MESEKVLVMLHYILENEVVLFAQLIRDEMLFVTSVRKQDGTTIDSIHVDGTVFVELLERFDLIAEARV